MTITIYQKPTCSTCRKVHAALLEAGVDVHAVNYYTDPIPKETLVGLVRKMGVPVRAILRTKEPAYAALGLGDADRTDDELLDAIVAHPDLLQRPIVERGDRAVLARPPERLKEILQG